jgi:hypothetical protein
MKSLIWLPMYLPERQARDGGYISTAVVGKKPKEYKLSRGNLMSRVDVYWGEFLFGTG